VSARRVPGVALVCGLALGACGAGPGAGPGGPGPSSTTTAGDPSTTATSTNGWQVEGTVSASPTCPVERADQPCPPRPVQTEVRAVGADGSVAARAGSGADGRFRLELPAGRYRLEADYPAGPGRGCTPVDIVVDAQPLDHVDIDCDTGIR
jgi:hypothetical protein